MAEIKKIKVDGVEHDIASGELHNQYCTIEILSDGNYPQTFKILLQTFKPITTIEEFRDYVRASIVPSGGSDYSLHILKFEKWDATSPSYLYFQNAYFGGLSCSIHEYNPEAEEKYQTIIDSASDISPIVGRIQSFTVNYTVIS